MMSDATFVKTIKRIMIKIRPAQFVILFFIALACLSLKKFNPSLLQGLHFQELHKELPGMSLIMQQIQWLQRSR